MQNLAKINSQLLDVGLPVTGVSAMHDTQSPSVFFICGGLVYRVDYVTPPTDSDIADTALVIQAIAGVPVTLTVKSRTPEELNKALDTHAKAQAAIAAQERAKEKPPVEVRDPRKPAKPEGK